MAARAHARFSKRCGRGSDYVGPLLLEQVGECLTRVGRCAGASLALDDGSRCEQFAGVARVLVHDARGDRFAAFEASARIEVRALATGVKISFAVRT